MTAMHLIVQAEVRYWEAAEVNGKEDTDGTLIPLRVGNEWRPIIDLESGRIVDWPAGTVADIHYKVCDQGEYWLGDATGKKSAKWKGHYVPDKLLAVGDRGYGDYIIMKVGADGLIVGWVNPAIDVADWTTP